MVYTIFSSFYITYPLINEIWSYNEACIPLGLEMVIVSFSILFILSNNVINIFDYFAIGFLLFIVAVGYESALFCYVTVAVSVLLIKSFNGKYSKNIEWIKEGFKYVIPLAISIMFRYIIGFLLISIFDLKYTVAGASDLYWFSSDYNKSFLETLSKLVKSNLIDYFVRCFSYFPIGEYVCALLIMLYMFIINIKKKGTLFLTIIVIVSPFLISIIQGNKLNYRTALPIQYYVAFVAYLVLSKYETKK